MSLTIYAFKYNITSHLNMSKKEFIKICNEERLWTDTGEMVYQDPVLLGFIYVYISIHPHVYCQIPAVLIERANSYNLRMMHYTNSNCLQVISTVITVAYLQYKLSGDKQYIDRLWLTKLNIARQHLEECFQQADTVLCVDHKRYP